jgi:ankyrin repeat protein
MFKGHIIKYSFILIVFVIAVCGVGTIHSQTNNKKMLNTAGYRKLAKASAQGNFDHVKKIMGQGYSPKPPQGINASALTGAIAYNHLKIARLLLDNGADANFENDLGESSTTVLGFALNLDNPYDAVKMLLNEGADPNYCENGETYLIDKAINKKNNDVIQLLINAGANVDKTSYISPPGVYYPTLGLLLSMHFDYDAAKMLIDAGADINAKIRYPSENLILSVLDFAEGIDRHSDIVTLLKRSGAKNYYVKNQTQYITIGDIFNFLGSNTSTSSSSSKDSYEYKKRERISKCEERVSEDWVLAKTVDYYSLLSNVEDCPCQIWKDGSFFNSLTIILKNSKGEWLLDIDNHIDNNKRYSSKAEVIRAYCEYLND